MARLQRNTQRGARIDSELGGTESVRRPVAAIQREVIQGFAALNADCTARTSDGCSEPSFGI
jgi:hypothetical protein